MTVTILIGASAILFGSFGSVIAKEEKQKRNATIIAYLGLAFLLLLSVIGAVASK